MMLADGNNIVQVRCIMFCKLSHDKGFDIYNEYMYIYMCVLYNFDNTLYEIYKL